MPEVMIIQNQTNGNILRCKVMKKTISLGLLNGKNMRGIAVPLKSILEKSPTYDMFTTNALRLGFKQNHIDVIEKMVMLKMHKNTSN